MELKEVTIQYYRSIYDSGPIDVAKSTALVGRNESGKSNILQALYSLNPDTGITELDKSAFFPRHMELKDCSDSTEIIHSRWKLNRDEKIALAKVFPPAKKFIWVYIERDYEGRQYVLFPEAPEINFPLTQIRMVISKFIAKLEAQLDEREEETSEPLKEALEALKGIISHPNNYIKWAAAATEIIATLRQLLVDAGIELSKEQSTRIRHSESIINTISVEATQRQNARTWIANHMPTFVFLDVYPQITGSMKISEYLARISNEESTSTDANFAKMCKVADLNLEKLNELQDKSQKATRKRLANEAGTKLTNEIQRLWKDKKLQVRFDLDGDLISTFISDPNESGNIDIELDERSRGFQWFFSFYLTLAADTNHGSATNAILLLDEPGLYLHANSQRDLLRLIETGFENQILYTTHSPFMVPIRTLETIRTVTFDKKMGTRVSNNLTAKGDAKTLFPLQAALGYDLTQTLFVGPKNLVVEGIIDFSILSSVSEYLSEQKGKVCLRPDIVITPGGGSQKILYMVLLLMSQKVNVVVLLDHEPGALHARDNLTRKTLISRKEVIFVSAAFKKSTPPECDIEDLLDEGIYEKLVMESHDGELKKLKGKKFRTTSKSPRIAKKFQEDFNLNELKFNKSLPMWLLVKKLYNNPDEVMTSETMDRFSALFEVVNSTMPT